MLEKKLTILYVEIVKNSRKIKNIMMNGKTENYYAIFVGSIKISPNFQNILIIHIETIKKKDVNIVNKYRINRLEKIIQMKLNYIKFYKSVGWEHETELTIKEFHLL
jgi:hypothetical protein